MKYKVGQKIKYYGYKNKIQTGTINRIVDGTYYVRRFHDMYEVKEEDVIGRYWGDTIGRTVTAVLILLGLWGAFKFFQYLANIEPTHIEPTAYEVCVEKIGHIYDNLNDTVSASVFHEDQPTSNLQALLDHCMSNL